MSEQKASLPPTLGATSATTDTIAGSGDPANGKHQSSTELACQQSSQEGEDSSEATTEKRDMVLSHKEAEAGSPADMAACGEEDPGSGLEFLVTKDE